MKKLSIYCFTLMIVFILFTQMIYSDDSVLKTEGFSIEDAVLLNALKVYDSNDDNVLTIEEMNSVSELNLDGLPIKTLKGLENFKITSISADGCGLENLDGIRDMESLRSLSISDNRITELGDTSKLDLYSINVVNNQLTDLADFIKILDTGANLIHISGNPFYEEAREYYFYNVDTKLTIVGAPGKIAWQKYASGDLCVDVGLVLHQNDFNIDNNLEFVIENPNVASLEEDAYIVNWSENLNKKQIDIVSLDFSYPGLLLKDKIAKIKLNNPGHTKMIIKCGEFEKAVDIWVVEKYIGDPFLTDCSLSDPMLTKVFKTCPTTDSGITTKKLLMENFLELYLKSEYNIKDLSCLNELSNITTLRFEDYDQELFNELVWGEAAENIKELYFVNNDIKEFVLKDSFVSLEKLCIRNSNLEKINIEDVLTKPMVIDLRDNNIKTAEDVAIPTDTRELYIENNPISEDIKEKEELSGKFIYHVDIIGNPGDINRDGVINAKDALLVLKSAAKITSLTEEQTKLGDINSDNIVNSEDALDILKRAANII